MATARAEMLRRTIKPEVRVLDDRSGLVEYVASDESLDSYREVIRAKGWRFNLFRKNAPFVDSHSYDSVGRVLGKVVSFGVKGKKLVETVQWAIDVPENKAAQLGFRMTKAGYLKAVSVGFVPVKMLSQADAFGPEREAWLAQLGELGLSEQAAPRAIYLEQEQIELSACVIGANPSALAKSYRAGILSTSDIDFLAPEDGRNRAERSCDGQGSPAAAATCRGSSRAEFLRGFELLVYGM